MGNKQSASAWRIGCARSLVQRGNTGTAKLKMYSNLLQIVKWICVQMYVDFMCTSKSDWKIAVFLRFFILLLQGKYGNNVWKHFMTGSFQLSPGSSFTVIWHISSRLRNFHAVDKMSDYRTSITCVACSIIWNNIQNWALVKSTKCGMQWSYRCWFSGL